MIEGLLWFDADPKRPAEEKIARAKDRYHAKFGATPNLCYVNPADLPEGLTEIIGIRLVPATNVLRHHFWIGEESLREAA